MADSDLSTPKSTRDFTAVVSLQRQAESLLSGNNSEQILGVQNPTQNSDDTATQQRTPSTAMAPVADRALTNFRQLFAPYNNRLSSLSSSLSQGRPRALTDPPSKRRKNNPKNGRSFVVKDTWTHEFFCLANHMQTTKPSRRENLVLQNAGLGQKTITFGRNDDALAFMLKIETVYPRIKSGGGFELLRSGATNKELIVICQPPSGYSVPFLKESSGIGQALVYVRPMQKSLDINIGAVFEVFLHKLFIIITLKSEVHRNRSLVLLY